jgi:signal transduction histidine kinase
MSGIGLAGISTGAAASGFEALPAPWILLGLPCVTLGLVALLAHVYRRQRRLMRDIRELRLQVHCIDQLLDVWQWRSDAQHRVVSLRPPHGAPSGDWSAAKLPAALWDLFPAEDLPALRAQLANTAALDDVAIRRTSATGPARRGLLRARTLTDSTGAFAGYHGTLRDLQDSPAFRPSVAERATSAATSQAAAHSAGPSPESTAQAEHESFSFTVSHDLRAPIRVVEGFTRIVKEDYGRLLDRVGNDHLDRVLGAAARMNNMIDALLALAKLSSQPLARQPVNLTQLAGYVADDLRRQHPERRVQIEIEAGMQVQGDPTLLREVIENLLGNAWKYTGKSAHPRISFARDPGSLDTYVVTDNGAGFDMRFADRLFGVFQRLHSANDFPGTGVGLASVRRIVRRHGGEIWGEAELNRGARFHFSLPQS